jgi:hypothetical protein
MYVALKVLSIFLISILTITSCNNVSPSNIQKVEHNNNNKFVIDVGKGKLGGNISFKINLSEGFKIKANEKGFTSVYNSITSYKIALVTSAGTGSNSLTTLPNGDSSDIYSIDKVDLSRTQTSPDANIYLTNVPDGTYWIAVSAYDSEGRNVTETTSTTGLIGSEKFAVSTGGGNSESSPNNGRVTVASDFSVPSTPVTIPLTLVDSYGATIEATVTIIDGSSKSKSDVQSVRFYLVDNNTDNGNIVDSNILEGSFNLSSGTKFDSLKAGTATTMRFKNIPVGSYYVAVAAYDSSSTVDSTTNITNLTANNNANITITTSPAPTGDMGTFSISNSGGSGSGLIQVNTGYIPNTTSSITLTLKLKD